jgi:hypothetical protein
MLLYMDANNTATTPAPASSNPTRTPSALAFARFGTIGFELYVAAVKAESERLFRAQKGT